MRRYEDILARYRFWDRQVQEMYEEFGEPLVDCILQNPLEVVELCRFIEQNHVRSYLEIGVWTGALVRALHEVFRFDLVAACDDGYAKKFGLETRLPKGALYLEARSDSAAFQRWRASIGKVDLVFIDANHHYKGVKRDLEINSKYPCKFIALHDIAGTDPRTQGPVRLWTELKREMPDKCIEIVRAMPDSALEATAMGIGIVKMR